jgi:hypothetical protein
MARTKAYRCGNCHSKVHTRRIYLRDERKDRAFRPIGYLCTKCESLYLDRVEYNLPKPKSHVQPLPKDEPLIFSGGRGTRSRDVRGIDDPFSDVAFSVAYPQS